MVGLWRLPAAMATYFRSSLSNPAKSGSSGNSSNPRSGFWVSVTCSQQPDVYRFWPSQYMNSSPTPGCPLMDKRRLYSLNTRSPSSMTTTLFFTSLIFCTHANWHAASDCCDFPLATIATFLTRTIQVNRRCFKVVTWPSQPRSFQTQKTKSGCDSSLMSLEIRDFL